MTRFEPALYSLAENAFLLEHAGESPAVALHSGLPEGCNIAAVKPALERFYELEELRKHNKQDWMGVEAVKESIRAYLQQHKQWTGMVRAGAPKNAFPSFYEFDSRGRAHRYGVGSDAGFVRSVFDQETGERKTLGVDLIPTHAEFVLPQIAKRNALKGAAAFPEALVEDDENGLIQCPVCKHTENYDAGVQTKRNLARTRMGKHLVGATKEPDAHRHLYAAVFGAPDPSIR
jgi:hypothetical protein